MPTPVPMPDKAPHPSVAAAGMPALTDIATGKASSKPPSCTSAAMDAAPPRRASSAAAKSIRPKISAEHSASSVANVPPVQALAGSKPYAARHRGDRHGRAQSSPATASSASWLLTPSP